MLIDCIYDETRQIISWTPQTTKVDTAIDQSMMTPHRLEVRNIFRLFQSIWKFCGMSCFCYPRENFKTSLVGLSFTVFYSMSCVVLFTLSAQSFTNNLTKNLSTVYLIGLVMIELVIYSSMLMCIWINFFLRKQIFKTLKMFEKFDEVTKKLFEVFYT